MVRCQDRPPEEIQLASHTAGSGHPVVLGLLDKLSLSSTELAVKFAAPKTRRGGEVEGTAQMPRPASDASFTP